MTGAPANPLLPAAIGSLISASTLLSGEGASNELFERNGSQSAPLVSHKLSVVVSPLAGLPGYENEPYRLLADDLVIQEGLTGPNGQVVFDAVPGALSYSVELANGHHFKMTLDDSPLTTSQDQHLARQGYRTHEALKEQFNPQASAQAYRADTWQPGEDKEETSA